MRVIAPLALLAFAGLAGCYGRVPPPPERATVVPGDLTTDLTLTQAPLPQGGLPQLIDAYHAALVRSAHPLGAERAEAYADAEIAGLRTRYAGRDAALRTELQHRLSPPPPRPLGTDPNPARPTDPEDAK